MVACGILVKVNDVTPAVSAGFFVRKPKGNGIRFVADYTAVNKALERPPHHFPAPQEVWQRVTAGSRFFVAGDLAAGYWQCELDYESSLLSTCITEFGKFRYTRLSMGVSSSGDLFNQETDRIIEGMTNIVKEVDDVLLFSDTIEGVAENLEEMLTQFEANNVTLAPKKFQFGTQVIFAGMKITQDGSSFLQDLQCWNARISTLLCRRAARWLGDGVGPLSQPAARAHGVKVIISGSLHQLHKSSLSSYKSQAISAKLLTEAFWLVGWLVGPTVTPL